jgi:hypothetical protein
VNFTNQTKRKRESSAKPVEAMLHGSDIVRNLLYIIERHSGYVFVLKEKQVRERRLGAFDL